MNLPTLLAWLGQRTFISTQTNERAITMIETDKYPSNQQSTKKKKKIDITKVMQPWLVETKHSKHSGDDFTQLDMDLIYKDYVDVIKDAFID